MFTWTARPGAADIVNRNRAAIVLITGGGASLAGLMAFGTAHALLILPIWMRLLGGLPFALAAGVTFAWAFDAVARARRSRSVAAGVQFGAVMATTLAPATLFNAALRLRGFDVANGYAIAASAVALALAAGAAAGWLLTRRRGAAAAFAVATLTMTLASGGPLPVAQSMRGLWLSLAFVPIVLTAGVVVAALHARVSPLEPL